MAGDNPSGVSAVPGAASLLGGHRGTAGSVRASLVLSFAERYLGVLVQLVQTTILARLLTPHDYGVYTVALVIVGLTAVLRDFGAVSFLFQERELSSRGVQTVYGISLLFSCIIALLIAASSGLIASFYHTSGLRSVLLVLSITILLAPYSSVVMTLLRREMNFRGLLWIEVAGAMMNGVVAIGFALIFGGFMSLAWGGLAAAVTTCLMAARCRPHHYRLRPSLREWRRVMPFGAVATLGMLLQDIGAQSPEIIAGRLLGLDAVGILTRADGLVAAFDRFIRGAVTPVAVASFAAQHRRGESLKASFGYATQMWTGIAWPFFAVLCLLAAPVIHILFGAGWDESIPILRLYCVAAGISSLTALNWNAYQAMGAVSSLLRIQLIVQPLKIALVFLACFYSLSAVAIALIAGALISVIVAYEHAHRLFDTSLANVIRGSAKSMGVTAGAIVVPLLVTIVFRMDAQQIWFQFAVGAAGACAGWLIGLRLFRHALWPEIALACGALRSKLPALSPGRGA